MAGEERGPQEEKLKEHAYVLKKGILSMFQFTVEISHMHRSREA